MVYNKTGSEPEVKNFRKSDPVFKRGLSIGFNVWCFQTG